MVRLTKIYTRTGDRGTTRLAGGQEVPKDSARLEAYGTVDELNACVGLVRAAVASHDGLEAADRETLLGWIGGVQQNLFNVGAELATLPADRREGSPGVGADDVTALERFIDALNAHLEPLQSFVLPGGGPLNAVLHQARTVCRRAERRVLTMRREEHVSDDVVIYLNRLSDALFVAARWVATKAGEDEVLWTW